MKKAFILIAIVLISACVSSSNFKQTASHEGIYYDRYLQFRADLNEARNIPVFPNEIALQKALANPWTRRIVIAFIDNPEENAFYAVTAFELTFTLKAYYNDTEYRDIKAFNVSSIEEARNLADKTVPVIMMVGPSLANKTAVTVDGFFVLSEGKDFSEVNRIYTDLDLAAAKLLLVMLESNIEEYYDL